MNAVRQQRDADGMMKPRRRGNHGGIDSADKFVIIRQHRCLAFRLRQAPRFRQRVHNADELNAGNLLGQPGVDAAKMAGADDG